MGLQEPTRAAQYTADKSRKIQTPTLLLRSSLPDYSGAQAYAVERLERELPAFIQYHTLYHTQYDVVPALERLAALENIEGEPLILLRTAAFFHDIGFVVQCSRHEEISKQIAAEALPLFHYTQRQIEIIQSLISTTRIPQSPHNLLDQIIADADLDVLGRSDFLTRNIALRAEMLATGVSMTDVEWYTSQLHFLTAHRYFTKSAYRLRNAWKQRNIIALENLLRLAISS
jgi:uncharacterized protein